MKDNKVDRLLSSGNVAIMSTKPTEVKVDKVDATPVKPEALNLIAYISLSFKNFNTFC